MGIRRWEPFAGLERLRDEMDRLFEGFSRLAGAGEGAGAPGSGCRRWT